MRLTSVALANYGPFRAQRIDFDPRPGRVNLLVAPNGYGKSVLRSAFCDLLFGVHPQTPMGFRFGYAGMRLTAEAVGPDGARFVFCRRKGQGNTLVDPDGAALDPASLGRLLGGTDRALLERLFALDTTRLRAGGEELLASGGALADALLSAAGGLRRARQMRTALEAARDELAPLRKSQTRPFYRALDRFLDARQRLDADMLKPELREQQETGLRQLQAELHGRNRLAEAAAQRVAQLQRVRRVIGGLRQHDAAAAWLADHPDAPLLPPDCAARLANADEALRQADHLLARERQERDAAAERVGTVHFDAALLGAAEEIERLVEHGGAAAKAARDIPERTAELRTTEARIADLLHQLGLALPVERAAEALPLRADVAAARRLFTEHATLRTERDRLPGEIAAAERAILATETEAARLPSPADPAEAARQARDLRRGGDPAQRAQDAARAVAEKRTALTAALARLPAWRDDVAGLLALPAQPLATYERLDAARAAAAAALDHCLRARDELRAACDAEMAQRDAIASGGPLPDAAAISAARARREQGWQLVYRHAFSDARPTEAEDQGWAGAVPLPLAYERAVNAADALADQRSRETERVSRTAEIARRIADLHPRLAAADAACAAAETALSAATAPWHGALAALSLPAEAAPGEVRALLSARDKAIDADRDLSLARDAAAALQQAQSAAAQSLAGALGVATTGAAAELPGLLAQTDQRVEAVRAADKDHARLRERLAAQRRAHDEKTDALARASQRWDALQQEWAVVRAALRRPAAEAPAATVALLDEFAHLDTAAQAAVSLRGRLRDMRADIDRFEADARALAARLAPDLAAGDTFAVVAGLRARLTEHRDRAKELTTLREQLDRAEQSLAAQQDRHARCAIALRTLLDGIGTDSVAAAQPLVALAAERTAQTETLRRGAEQLARDGDGNSLEALRAEAARFPIDQVPGEIETAEAERRQAAQDAQALAARIATADTEMDTQARATATLQAAADQQAAVATIGRALDDALLLHVAGLLLGRAMEEVDAAGSSALLGRIGAQFRTITGGAYERVIAAESGDGDARLLAVERGFAADHKAVADLSDGTRDQLFLALRLVAIEDHAATAPPLPFVGDDILQTFDDARALAALRALVALSARVQVILLSHHPHLHALARELGADAVHVCEIGAAPAA